MASSENDRESDRDKKMRRYSVALQKLADKNGGQLTAEIVVEDGRKPRSHLHDWFKWNINEAANLYHLEQARKLIRMCFVIVRDEVAPERTVRVRSFEHVDGAYRRIDDIMQNESWTRELLNRLAREISAMRQRYSAIASLQSAYAPIDNRLAEAEQMAAAAKAG